MCKKLIGTIAFLFLFVGLVFAQLVVKNSSNSELMRVTPDGLLGIGTSSPAARLEVNSKTSNVSGLRFTQLTSASVPGGANNLALSVDGAGNVILTTNIPPAGDNLGNHMAGQNLQMNGWWVSNDGGNEGVWVDNAGRVGLGTSIPTTDLHIQNNVPKLPIPELLIEHTGASLAALSYKNQGQIITSGIDPGDVNGYKITAINGFATNAYADAVTMMRVQTALPIFGILDINHQSRADGWLSIMFLTPPAWTQIPFDQKLYDEHNEFNTAQPFSFVALQEGYYQVEARTELLTHEIQMPAWPAGAYVEIAIYLNMQPFAYGNKLALANGAGEPLFHNNAPIVTRVVHLLPGSNVSIWVFHNLPQPVPVMPGQAHTYVSIHKIS